MAFVPILIFWIMKTAVLLLGIRFHLKTAYAFQLKRPKKAIWQRFTKKWIVSFEKASFRDSGGFRGGVPTQLQVYIRHCESGYTWRRWPLKMWRLSVTNYRFRCLGGVECICSVDYRKRKKKSMRFQIRANQDGKQKGYVRLNENISILFWRQNEYFWEQSRVSGA